MTGKLSEKNKFRVVNVKRTLFSLTDMDSWNYENLTFEGNRTEDNINNSSEQFVPDVGLLKAVEVKQLQTRDKNEILQSHTLMIRNSPKGLIFECLKCQVHYANAHDFKIAHDIEGKQKDLKEELEFIEEPLWEAVPEDLDVEPNLVENFLIEEIIEDTGQEDVESHYNTEKHCYNCLQCGLTFLDLETAQNHTCEEIIESNDQQVLEDEEYLNDLIENCADEGVDITDTVQKLNTQIFAKPTKNETEIFTCEICNISFRAERYLM